MITFDASQQRVVELSTDAHARVLGATGSGKTQLIASLMQWWLEDHPSSPGERLIVVPSRRHASQFRDRIESAIPASVTGTYARTASSLALMLCNAYRRWAGKDDLQLMTGTRQDEVLREALQEVESPEHIGLTPEALDSVPFRTELRDMWRVLDDFSMTPRELRQYAIEVRATSDLPSQIHRLTDRWEAIAQVVEHAQLIAERRFPTERTANGILAHATRLLEHVQDFSWPGLIPRLIYVDDAADVGEGALALCAALANRGTKFWVFGDPDISTAAFQGEPTRVLAGLHAELARRGARSSALTTREQVVHLETVHRHGGQVRSLITSLSQRVGSASGWEHRSARATDERASTVEFTSAHTFSEQIGVIAYRLRHRHLGLHDAPAVPWSNMAVICRSADEVQQLASALEDMNIPTEVTSGGIVLGQHRLIRDLLRVLQDALGIAPLGGADVVQLLLGHLGGLDPLALRRLDHAVMLNERKVALAEAREPRPLAAVYVDAVNQPESIPDMAEGRALARLARIVHAARDMHRRQGTAREVLWQAWHASRLSDTLTHRALSASGALAAMGHRALDAVIELFFAFERHEEQLSDVSIADLIDEILSSEVPQDSLALRSRREAVVVTTPQGASGEEYRVVCIAGPQEGVWPNLRSRGSLVGAHALQTLLRGETPSTFDRTHTLHEELRLFLQACSRAADELLVVAREDDEEFPSAFFHLGAPYLRSDLPNSTLTLRGYTAAMRRRVLQNPEDTEARNTLAYLAQEEVPGAAPDEWYGMLPPSSTEPLVGLGQGDEKVHVSPSQIQTVETCPLNWFVSTYAAEQGNVHARLGTLIHYALEHAVSETEVELRSFVAEGWQDLEFESAWIEEQAREEAHDMTAGLADYLRDAQRSGRALASREAAFSVSVGNALVSGTADRIETRVGDDGIVQPLVIDLKTGRTHVSSKDAEQDPQLLAYQLGLLEAEFSPHGVDSASATQHRFGSSAGAALLYVHPKATTTRQRYRLVEQPALTDESRQAFIERVTEAAHAMSQGQFEAKVEHHCSDPNQFGNCAIHIIPAVSYE